MSHTWSEVDANGKKLTDGRVCLIIRSDENPNMPAIYTYGKDRDEVLDKLAKTTETAQATIHKHRTTPPTAPAAPAPPRAAVTAGDLAQATADLTNPAKVTGAVKTILRAGGVDIDAQERTRIATNFANLCQEWEREHPEFPFDERNSRMMVDRAIIHAGGSMRNAGKQHLDSAYRELTAQGMFFAPKPDEDDEPPVQPRGSEDSRTVRTATTHRRNALRAEPPVVVNKPKYTPEELDKLNSKQIADKIKNEPGFLAEYEKVLATTARRSA